MLGVFKYYSFFVQDFDDLLHLGLPLAQIALPVGLSFFTFQAISYIVDVRRVPSVPVRCVQVSGADHLYLAGRSMIPTHNSTLALDVATGKRVARNVTPPATGLAVSHGKDAQVYAYDAEHAAVIRFSGTRKLKKAAERKGLGDTPSQLEIQ